MMYYMGKIKIKALLITTFLIVTPLCTGSPSSRSISDQCLRLQGRRLELSACRSVGLLHFLKLFYLQGPSPPVQGVLERVLELVAFPLADGALSLPVFERKEYVV
jgi:hypothetical protein